MNYKRKLLYIIFSFLVWTLVLAFPLCMPDPSDDYTCTGSVVFVLGEFAQALFLFPIVIIILAGILLLTKEQVFNSWLKFSKIFLPIAIILIAIFPAEAGFLNPDKETVIWLTSGLFFFFSLLIIAVKSWKLRKGNQKV